MEGLSIIIPTLNEEENVKSLFPKWLPYLKDLPVQLILVDGGSEDQTISEGEALGFEWVRMSRQCRALQMNAGAELAHYPYLFFMHADVQLPPSFWSDIRSFKDKNLDFGLFPYQFRPTSFLLKINAAQTHKKGFFTGGGDQGLWIRKEVFERERGFDESLPIMEDFELFWRLQKQYQYDIAQNPLKVSSRKYQKNAYLKVQLVNLYVFLAFRMGLSPQRLARQYKRWL